MFGLFGNSHAKRKARLQKEYEKKLAEAMHAQRNGDIRAYSNLSEQADQLHQTLLQLKP
ncbi:MAG: DUF6435 family protein [Nitrincola lacisaponensis]|uniref:Lacal_2735 family protein n=1 Tax=Nitrincola lacisaponensis TaxID=267850 RepID=A0A063YA49_9GAMM|nr:DUF6435 family protein [Nitrincola lacisaponensis]KDE41207.1 hypothetical protein ADINL_0280 [Nitrincola lacisaponensis]